MVYQQKKKIMIFIYRRNFKSEYIINKIPFITFNNLCEKFFITEIEYLSIDTEGLYYEIILNSIDQS